MLIALLVYTPHKSFLRHMPFTPHAACSFMGGYSTGTGTSIYSAYSSISKLVIRTRKLSPRIVPANFLPCLKSLAWKDFRGDGSRVSPYPYPWNTRPWNWPVRWVTVLNKSYYDSRPPAQYRRSRDWRRNMHTALIKYSGLGLYPSGLHFPGRYWHDIWGRRSTERRYRGGGCIIILAVT